MPGNGGSTPVSALGRNALFEGLGPEALEELASLMRQRRFEPGDVICRAGEPGDSLLVLMDGLARVTLGQGGGEVRVVARLRRGDVIGEMALVTGEPRSATVVAAVPTSALELDRDDFAAVIARRPSILANLGRILSRKLAETTVRVGEERSRGEAVALLVGEAGASVVPELLESARLAGPRPFASLEAAPSLEVSLEALDDLLAQHATVVVTADLGYEQLLALVDGVDRALALVADESELGRLEAALTQGSLDGQRVDVAIVGRSAADAERLRSRAGPATPVVRVVVTGADAALPPRDAGWISRHLSRTKLGLALGAGGAKGYAHIGALYVLEESGYTVDCVAGSSIGAIVGAWLAAGLDAPQVESSMRHAFRPEVVVEMFKLTLSSTSSGLETMTSMLRESTHELTFADLVLPLSVMAVDLNSRRPAPVTDGPLWQALLAATALAGFFPPYERNGQRLVDGLALVPVPTDAVVEAGADVTLAVDLMGGERLDAWPGVEPPVADPRRERSRMLDALLEVMDLAQHDSSVRHAARADVVVTPAFGPGTWRDFHLADLFLEAGRRAAEQRLPALRALATPQGR